MDKYLFCISTIVFGLTFLHGLALWGKEFFFGYITGSISACFLYAIFLYSIGGK